MESDDEEDRSTEIIYFSLHRSVGEKKNKEERVHFIKMLQGAENNPPMLSSKKQKETAVIGESSS